MQKKFIVTLAIVAGLFAGASYASTASNPDSNESLAYAKCLQQRGITMYGIATCPHCKHQKAEFGEYFQYVNYVDCNKDVKTCNEKQILAKHGGYPTWLMPDGREIKAGTIKDVATAAGCTLVATQPAIPPKPQAQMMMKEMNDENTESSNTQESSMTQPASSSGTDSSATMPVSSEENKITN
ncbi:MAG: hypothetical protein SFT81_03705 [Candidatus Caenarcaniphilales bacterium]|nr:hypothetical protein [Candidatus Caenarcaniphilales bacterium]